MIMKQTFSAMRRISSVLILLVVGNVHSMNGDHFMCQLVSEIFNGKTTLVHHWMDNSTSVWGLAQCSCVRFLENPVALYSFNVSCVP